MGYMVGIVKDRSSVFVSGVVTRERLIWVCAEGEKGYHLKAHKDSGTTRRQVIKGLTVW